ncbi:hypothetical protein FN846DRAFT_1019358 [Sphaerosporella brunnea]|uniref:Uncharacterized protein n=1 Tax=Sphaerosporella brunnea TaxID=1250544 RepID=A0A5J5F6H3_9PEZI|nr:hypothetical protein FN846DRAFT_1019358 [Sphaerosporella brunnea]
MYDALVQFSDTHSPFLSTAIPRTRDPSPHADPVCFAPGSATTARNSVFIDTTGAEWGVHARARDGSHCGWDGKARHRAQASISARMTRLGSHVSPVAAHPTPRLAGHSGRRSGCAGWHHSPHGPVSPACTSRLGRHFTPRAVLTGTARFTHRPRLIPLPTVVSHPNGHPEGYFRLSETSALTTVNIRTHIDITATIFLSLLHPAGYRNFHDPPYVHPAGRLTAIGDFASRRSTSRAATYAGESQSHTRSATYTFRNQIVHFDTFLAQKI